MININQCVENRFCKIIVTFELVTLAITLFIYEFFLRFNFRTMRAVVKAPKSCHTTPIFTLSSLASEQQLNASNANSYRLLRLTKSLQLLNLHMHNLISVQPARSTRSSSLVTVARPLASSSLRIIELNWMLIATWRPKDRTAVGVRTFRPTDSSPHGHFASCMDISPHRWFAP